MLKHLILSAISLVVTVCVNAASPIDSLAMRVTEGTSEGRIIFDHVDSSGEFFEIDSLAPGKVAIRGNSDLSMAVGLDWYLKYVAGIHIAWDNLTEPLPEKLPMPSRPIRQSASVDRRYYLNYCTFSYSMPFWDEDRWMKEIDWMALHGINMPLAMTGIESVWRNLLLRLGYSEEEVGEFISGPAYFAWWQMNNLEGWGGPLHEQWYERQEILQKKILARMRSLGMQPVFPGYSGMVPRNIGSKLGLDINDPGRWCGFQRPAFLSTTEARFDSIADLYYEELTRLYGTAPYYSMDPFHEGGVPDGVSLPEAGEKIMGAMKRANKDARWVVQSWGGNPRRGMTDTLGAGDLVILDLYSDKDAKWRRSPDAYGKHDWVYCMLLNFGGNVGLHGRADYLTSGFYDAIASPAGKHLTGVGATPEGIENNPVMYELLFELPWRERFTPGEWLDSYLRARYNADSLPQPVVEAWRALMSTVYNAPAEYPGQGTVESLFCARPSWTPRSASTWGYSQLFYNPDSTAKAPALMAEQTLGGSYRYDSIDIARQANADRANMLLEQMASTRASADSAALTALSEEFLALLLTQDSLLSILPDTRVDTWLDAAGALAGSDPRAEELYRTNAAQLITVWGDSLACNAGGLHDYSHREWGGLLRELYYPRWKAFFDHELRGAPAPDYYAIEKEWVARRSRPVVNRVSRD